MGQLLFIMIIITAFTWSLRFIGYEAGIALPVLILVVIIVAILRSVAIQRKNNY